MLLVDLDHQGNATMGSGVDKYALQKTVREVLLAEATIQETIIACHPSAYDLLPINSDLM